ncbi:phosphoribosylanthranilate isomerase [Hymenobacter sp. BT175]|uniref:phosphoribosylanthranilate isomerase n=1 Tax=Hymenobacter translucens TaxID=2886507 RepID=UPI001D0E34B8|nr:phosphoribosylanthranilate isomerase [Hymenobacter translucens]MCC2545298.1 phosphoribosylanthranilate isomerase [Hymenobacter translucens]
MTTAAPAPAPEPRLSSHLNIKVCGMKYAANITEVAALGPDFMGFIFYDQSRRHARPELQAEQVRALPASIQRVGVFVNETTERIQQHVAEYGLNLVQLHGAETPAQCAELQAAGIPVSKAFAVGAEFDFRQLEPYAAHCTYFLFDTKGELPGGNGTTFDWQILEHYRLPVPYFLAGGLSLAHADALRRLRLPGLFALDLNSCFETAPGRKDVPLLTEMFRLLRP